MALAKSYSKINEKKQIIILLTASLSITLFLFFIDEGYYNFNWVNNAGNWIAFFIYFTVIFAFQVLFSNIFLKKLKPVLNLVLSIIGGTIISLSFLILGFLFWL